MLRGSFWGTGRVACAEELDFLAALCVRHDAIAISDEVYEGCVFAGSGAAHLRLVDRAGMRARTLTLGSAGKLFALTGWRVGWIYADASPGARAAPLLAAVKKVHGHVK